MTIHASKEILDNPCHHYGMYFDEMDAFDPIAIEKEYRWQSQHPRSQHSRASGLLRRMHYRADGIPKVVNVQVDNSKNRSSSIASLPTSTTPIMSAPRCLDVDQDRRSRRLRQAEEIRCNEMNGNQDGKTFVHEIDSLQSSQKHSEGSIDELLLEALRLDDEHKYGGYCDESSSSPMERFSLRNLKNCDRRASLRDNSNSRSMKSIDRMGTLASLTGQHGDPRRRHASLSPRKERSLGTAASSERSGVDAVLRTDAQGSQSLTRRQSHRSLNATSSNIEHLKETSEKCRTGWQRQHLVDSVACGSSSYRSHYSVDRCTSFSSSMERVTLGRAGSVSASMGKGSREMVQRLHCSADPPGLTYRDKPSNCKYIDIPTRPKKIRRSHDQNSSEYKGSGKINDGSTYMNQIFKSAPHVPDQAPMARNKERGQSLSYMDSLFGQNGPDLGSAVRNTTLARASARR